MQGLLVRVAIDQAFGAWNAPVDPDTREFVYVPIPEPRPFAPRMTTPYRRVLAPLASFAAGRVCDVPPELPAALHRRQMHLDPDFEALTYGDQARRGAGLLRLTAGDLVVFYAGLRPCRPCAHRLLYAIIGLYRIHDITRVADVPAARHAHNAHTRRRTPRLDDIVVRADPAGSGRLERCIPIGERRDGAYRVRRDLLAAWGGISARDGFIQRSAVPPALLDARRFLRWFERQRPALVARNH